MNREYPATRRMAHVLLAMAMTMAPTGNAWAGLVGTEEIIEQQDSAAERARVESFLAREDVQRQMIEMGVSPAEAARRAGGMTAGEVRQVSQNIAALPAGQGKGVSVVLLLLLVILLILVI